MTHLFLAAAMALVVVSAQAQPEDAAPPTRADAAAERSRIAVARQAEAARYEQQQAGCYARFAVSDCHLANRAHQRALLDLLRRQELTINAAERQQKGTEQLERILGKLPRPEGSAPTP